VPLKNTTDASPGLSMSHCICCCWLLGTSVRVTTRQYLPVITLCSTTSEGVRSSPVTKSRLTAEYTTNCDSAPAAGLLPLLGQYMVLLASSTLQLPPAGDGQAVA
jgi:hypothetical protein